MGEPGRDKPTGRWLGIDVGGANLKLATADGFAREMAFPLWKQPERLADAIATLVASAPPHRGFAVTMTGELADCYVTKAEGVAAIVAAVRQAAGSLETRFYSLSGLGFLDPQKAAACWQAVAAANFHALAAACRRDERIDGDLLIDVGSTTTDILPLGGDTAACDTGACDTDRLIAGELVYQGVGRTPVCAVVDALPYRGHQCPVAAELFATTADVALLLGHTTPSPDCETADGRPLSVQHSIDRLGRMLCADQTQFNREDALVAANAVDRAMQRRLEAAVEQVAGRLDRPLRQVVLSGGGAWLARKTLQRGDHPPKFIDLADLIGQDASRCAPAWAVASLLDKEDGR